jgi:hypothetical protein
MQTTDGARTWHAVDTTPQPAWTTGLAPVPNGCPSQPIATDAKINPVVAAVGAARDFVLRTRGWTGEDIGAVYPVTQPAGQFGVMFSSNVSKDCGAAVAGASYGVELSKPSVTQDSSRTTALVVAPFADGWKVRGFYR